MGESHDVLGVGCLSVLTLHGEITVLLPKALSWPQLPSFLRIYANGDTIPWVYSTQCMWGITSVQVPSRSC